MEHGHPKFLTDPMQNLAMLSNEEKLVCVWQEQKNLCLQ
jgi:hypothetical protein